MYIMEKTLSMLMFLTLATLVYSREFNFGSETTHHVFDYDDDVVLVCQHNDNEQVDILEETKIIVEKSMSVDDDIVYTNSSAGDKTTHRIELKNLHVRTNAVVYHCISRNSKKTTTITLDVMYRVDAPICITDHYTTNTNNSILQCIVNDAKPKTQVVPMFYKNIYSSMIRNGTHVIYTQIFNDTSEYDVSKIYCYVYQIIPSDIRLPDNYYKKCSFADDKQIHVFKSVDRIDSITIADPDISVILTDTTDSVAPYALTSLIILVAVIALMSKWTMIVIAIVAMVIAVVCPALLTLVITTCTPYTPVALMVVLAFMGLKEIYQMICAEDDDDDEKDQSDESTYPVLDDKTKPLDYVYHANYI